VLVNETAAIVRPWGGQTTKLLWLFEFAGRAVNLIEPQPVFSRQNGPKTPPTVWRQYPM